MPFLIIRDDITRLNTDAIVNAANEQLLPGGGVCGAIHRAAGSALAKECAQIGGCPTGEARITKGYNLPAKYVIHTVGPIWGSSDNDEHYLYNCYINSMELAINNGCESIAFPLISAGIYGCPKRIALETAKRAIKDFLSCNELNVTLVLFDRRAMELASEVQQDIAQFIDDNYVAEHNDENRRFRFLSAEKRSVAAPAANIFGQHMRGNLQEEDSPCMDSCAAEIKPSLAEMLNELDLSFSQKLLKLIDASGRTDVEVYKRANIDRKLFSKIRSDKGYRPKKQTVLAFAIALELSLDDTKELLGAAGFALSKSSKADIIVEFFIRRGCYDIFEINDALFAYDQSLIGG